MSDQSRWPSLEDTYARPGQIKKLKRRLQAVLAAIEALDADLTARRLGADEHGRRRAEREREAGRLLATIRRAQADARGRSVKQAGISGGRRPAWMLSPPGVVAAGCALLVAGIGGGVAVSRWLAEGRRPTVPVARPASTADPGQTALMTRIDLGALRQAAGSEDAAIPTLLEMAHGALDQGRLDEARSTYQRVLARDPRNVEAITHLAAVLYQEGQVDEALVKVEEALRIDPAYIHAHWDRTQYLFYGKRDFPGAVKAAEAFLQLVPKGPDADSVRRLMRAAQAEAVKGRIN